jgi:hypothetical protein
VAQSETATSGGLLEYNIELLSLLQTMLLDYNPDAYSRVQVTPIRSSDPPNRIRLKFEFLANFLPTSVNVRSYFLTWSYLLSARSGTMSPILLGGSEETYQDDAPRLQPRRLLSCPGHTHTLPSGTTDKEVDITR